MPGVEIEKDPDGGVSDKTCQCLHFHEHHCVPHQSQVGVARPSGCLASAREPRVSYRDHGLPRMVGLIAAGLHPPRRCKSPSTLVNVRRHFDGCLACQLSDGDSLEDVPRVNRDDRVARAALRGLLVPRHGHVTPREDVPRPVVAWQACHAVLEHLVDLTDACVTSVIAMSMLTDDEMLML